MDTKTLSQNACSFAQRIEQVYLDPDLSESERTTIYEHLKICLSCRKEFTRLGLLYSQVLKELKKPVSNKVLDLAKRINQSDTRIALVVCEPVSDQEKETRFKTKLVFSANGKPDSGYAKFQDFDFSSLSDGSIAIRAMTDKKQNKVLFYLWSKNEPYEKVTINFSGVSEALKFSAAGVSESRSLKIEDFDDKLIYLEKHKATLSPKVHKQKSFQYNFLNN